MAVRQRTWVDRDGKSHTKWTVDFVFKHASGRRERVRELSPVNTKVGAQEYERQLRNERLAPTKQEEKKPTPTLTELKVEFMAFSAINNKPSAIKAKEDIFRKHLVPAFGTFRLSEITSSEIDKFVAEKVRSGLAKKTVKNILTVLSAALRQAKKWGHIEKVPEFTVLVVPDADFDFLSLDEAPRFEEAAHKESATLWGPMVTFACNTGLRIGELCELRWTDVDMKAGRVRVSRSVYRGHIGTTKSGKAREVPLNKYALEALGARRSVGLPLVFCNPDGTALNPYNNCQNAILRISKRAGLGRDIGFHVLRHTFASHLVMRGVSLKAVQELLGHAHITTTMKYAHLSPNVKTEAVRALEAKEPEKKAKEEA